jgi:hypothetical protein
MADPTNDEKFDKGKGKQTIGGQQGHRSEYGAQGDQTGGTGGQPIGGNDGGTGSGTPLTQGAEFGGKPATGQAQPGAGSAPPRSLGTKGTEFGQMADYDRSGQQGQSGTGQADLGSQAGSTLSGHTDQQDLGQIGGEVDQPASYGGGLGGRRSSTEGEGFILQQGNENASSAKTTGGIDFARDGRGVTEDEDDGDGHPS